MVLSQVEELRKQTTEYGADNDNKYRFQWPALWQRGAAETKLAHDKSI